MFSKHVVFKMFHVNKILKFKQFYEVLCLFSENKHRYEYVKINFRSREKVKHAVRMRYIWFFLNVVLSRVVLISCHCELEA